MFVIEKKKFCYNNLQEYEQKLGELEEIIHKKTKELKRIKESFDTIKTANDSLKKQVIERIHFTQTL